MDEIYFGGLIDSYNVKIAPFKPKKGIKNAFDIIEQAFFQLTSTDEGKELYGDPNKGATIEQAWRTSGIYTGKWPVCLLVTNRPNVPVDAISRLIRINSSQIIKIFKDLFSITKKIGIQVLYFDGKIGHSIALINYNKSSSRFIFHDPCPEVSLLKKEYNYANVDAIKVDSQIWSITDEELENIVFAAFVAENFWAEITQKKIYNFN